MCRFTLAVNRPYSSQDGERQTDFFECTAWRDRAEIIARNTKKGSKLCVGGYIQIRNYEDNQGTRRTAVDVIVQESEFLSPKPVGDSFDDASEAPRASAPKKKPALQAMDDDSDIPF
jgi:single-strand DNA-binding protein